MNNTETIYFLVNTQLESFKKGRVLGPLQYAHVLHAFEESGNRNGHLLYQLEDDPGLLQRIDAESFQELEIPDQEFIGRRQGYIVRIDGYWLSKWIEVMLQQSRHSDNSFAVHYLPTATHPMQPIVGEGKNLETAMDHLGELLGAHRDVLHAVPDGYLNKDLFFQLQYLSSIIHPGSRE